MRAMCVEGGVSAPRRFHLSSPCTPPPSSSAASSSATVGPTSSPIYWQAISRHQALPNRTAMHTCMHVFTHSTSAIQTAPRFIDACMRARGMLYLSHALHALPISVSNVLPSKPLRPPSMMLVGDSVGVEGGVGDHVPTHSMQTPAICVGRPPLLHPHRRRPVLLVDCCAQQRASPISSWWKPFEGLDVDSGRPQ